MSKELNETLQASDEATEQPGIAEPTTGEVETAGETTEGETATEQSE